MKKFASLMIALVLFVICGSTAIASSHNSQSTQGIITPLMISPRYTYTSSITAALSFSGGQAHCSGNVKPSGKYECSITVTLYKQNGSNWDYVTSWSDSASGGSQASAGGSIGVGSGTYKVVSSGNVAGKEFPTKSVTRTKN